MLPSGEALASRALVLGPATAAGRALDEYAPPSPPPAPVPTPPRRQSRPTSSELEAGVRRISFDLAFESLARVPTAPRSVPSRRAHVQPSVAVSGGDAGLLVDMEYAGDFELQNPTDPLALA